MACPPSETLVAYASGTLPSGEREGILGHLEACPDCAAETGALAPALEAPPRRRLWIPVAAAAALLLGAFLLPRVHREENPRVLPPPPAASDPFRPGLEIPLGRSALLTLEEGAKADVKGSRIEWRSGDLSIDTRGEPLVLAWPGAELSFRDATVVLAAPESRVAWIAEARADEGGPKVTLLRGEAILSHGSQVEFLRPGKSPGRFGGGWHEVPGLPGKVRDGLMPLGDPAGDFAWEALVRRPTESALFGVVWTADAKGWKFPLGYGAVGPAGIWIRLRLERRLGWTRLTAGGIEVLKGRDADLAAKAYPNAQAALGIYAWGGDVEIEEARWR